MYPIRATIAVFEDDTSVRLSLSALLESDGYVALAFASSAEFFESGRPESCACFVLDVEMQDETGFDILTRLRQMGYSAPAVFISGRVTADMRAKAAALQADFLQKPTMPRTLLAKIAEAVGRR